MADDIVKQLCDLAATLNRGKGRSTVTGAVAEIERLRITVDDSTAALSRAATALMCKVDDNSVLRQEISNLHSEINYLRLQIVRLSIPQEDTHG